MAKIDLVNHVFNSCLLTGGNGYLGKHIHQHFDSCNIDVFTLGSSDANNYVFDLSNQVPTFERKFDAVIHCAGKAHTFPKTPQERQSFFDVNVTGTKNLLTALETAASLPKYFVFMSSVSVYGLSEGIGITEDQPLRSMYPYGLSKIKAEELIWNWCKEHDVTCLILRLPLLAGKNPPGNLKMMINSIRKGYYFNISSGAIRKSIVMAEDIARIIPTALMIGGIYNLTDGHHPSFSELANLIATQLKRSMPKNAPKWLNKFLMFLVLRLEFISPINAYKFKKLTSSLTFDDTKARRMLNWNPRPVLENFRIKE